MTAINMLPETHALAEQIGELVYSWGFKRIHGRLWTHLLLSKKPLDAADFVRLMGISKALVSITLRELMELDVIQLAGKSARGTQTYRANTRLQDVFAAVLHRRERPAVAKVKNAFESLNGTPAETRSESGLSNENVAQLGDWIARGSRMLDAFLRRDPGTSSVSGSDSGEPNGSEESESREQHYSVV